MYVSTPCVSAAIRLTVNYYELRKTIFLALAKPRLPRKDKKKLKMLWAHNELSFELFVKPLFNNN